MVAVGYWTGVLLTLLVVAVKALRDPVGYRRVAGSEGMPPTRRTLLILPLLVALLWPLLPLTLLVDRKGR